MDLEQQVVLADLLLAIDLNQPPNSTRTLTQRDLQNQQPVYLPSKYQCPRKSKNASHTKSREIHQPRARKKIK